MTVTDDAQDVRVILASASRSRRALLAAAGIACDFQVAAIDEDEVKESLRAHQATAAQVAETLAEMKAARVSRRAAGALVIGADQVLDLAGRQLDKPGDRSAAAAQLDALAGRTHELLSAVCVVRDGQRLWHYNGRARLTMRAMSKSTIEAYLDGAGDAVLGTVGCYHLEGLGVQLFERVEGDYFTVLGLPLLPLLGFLRPHGVGLP